MIFTGKKENSKAQKITIQRKNIKDIGLWRCLLRENFTQTKKGTAWNAEARIYGEIKKERREVFTKKKKNTEHKNNNAATLEKCVLLRNFIKKREGFSRKKKKVWLLV